MSTLLSVVNAARNLGIKPKLVSDAIEAMKLEPKHSYPYGRGVAKLYDPEELMKAVTDYQQAQELAKQQAAQATAEAEAVDEEVVITGGQLAAIEARFDELVHKVDEVGQAVVEIQHTEEEANVEYRTLAEQNRHTFKAVTDLASATASAFKELSGMMINQVNRLSDVAVRLEAYTETAEKNQTQSGADTKAILDLLRELAKPAPVPPAPAPVTPPSPNPLAPAKPTPLPAEIVRAAPAAPVAFTPAPVPAPAPVKAPEAAPAPKVSIQVPMPPAPRLEPLTPIEANLGMPASKKVVVSAPNAITEAFADVGNRKSKASKTNLPKPSVVVVGLVGTQQEFVRKDFSDAVNIEFFDGSETMRPPFARACDRSEWVFALTKVRNAVFKNTADRCKGRLTFVEGHTSGMKMEITKWLADRNAQAVVAATTA